MEALKFAPPPSRPTGEVPLSPVIGRALDALHKKSPAAARNAEPHLVDLNDQLVRNFAVAEVGGEARVPVTLARDSVVFDASHDAPRDRHILVPGYLGQLTDRVVRAVEIKMEAAIRARNAERSGEETPATDIVILGHPPSDGGMVTPVLIDGIKEDGLSHLAELDAKIAGHFSPNTSGTTFGDGPSMGAFLSGEILRHLPGTGKKVNRRENEPGNSNVQTLFGYAVEGVRGKVSGVARRTIQTFHDEQDFYAEQLGLEPDDGDQSKLKAITNRLILLKYLHTKRGRKPEGVKVRHVQGRSDFTSLSPVEVVRDAWAGRLFSDATSLSRDGRERRRGGHAAEIFPDNVVQQWADALVA